MKTEMKIAVLLFIAGVLSVSSCKKEEDEIAKPQVSLNELGLHNTKIGYVGSDLHVEANIEAEGNINRVSIVIHPEGSATWEFDTTYTKFSGMKNATFHEHIDIPLTADTGEYHFHLTVTDMEGNSTFVESEMEIKQPTDLVAPQITVTAAPSSGQSFANGGSISISGNITDDVSLGGIYIGLVRDDQSLADASVNADNTITLLHFHDFSNPLSYVFSASIIVGATNDNDITPDPVTWAPGNYYILVKCKDAFGSNWAYSNHYPIVIN